MTFQQSNKSQCGNISPALNFSMFGPYTYILSHNDSDKYREPGTSSLEETWMTNSETGVFQVNTPSRGKYLEGS